MTREVLAAHLVQERVPEHLHQGLMNYLIDHRPVGSFLLAVLENNLALAIAYCGDQARGQTIEAVVRVLANYAHEDAWGSVEHVAKWLLDGDAGRRR